MLFNINKCEKGEVMSEKKKQEKNTVFRPENSLVLIFKFLTSDARMEHKEDIPFI